MSYGSVPPVPPPGRVETPFNPSYVLIGIGAVVLTALSMMGSGSSSSTSSAAGGNPIIGTWKLVDTNTAAYCQAERKFRTYTEAEVIHGPHAIYVVQPTYVEVSYGGPNIEEWELHGRDDVTLRMIVHSSPGPSQPGVEAQNNCRYHRK